MQTKDDIKKMLKKYGRERKEHLQLIKELENTITLTYSPASPNLDGMPRGSGVSRPTENKATSLEALQDRYKAEVEKMAAEQLVIEDMIAALDTTQRRLARFRYIDGLEWEEVCVAMSYSWRQTHRIHSAMLDRLVALANEKEGQKIVL